MNVKNTFLVCANNFMLVWKQLLYSLIIMAVVVLSLFGLLKPVATLLKNEGWLEMVKELIETVYTNPTQMATGFTDVAKTFYVIITDNFSTLWGNYIISILLVVLVPAFANGISGYVMGDLANGRMNALANYAWVRRLILTLKKSVIYSLLLLLLWLPFVVMVVLLLIGYGFVAKNLMLATLFLPLLVLLIITMLAIKGSFSLWFMPICVNEDCSVFKAFLKNFKIGAKNFGRTFLALFALYVIEFFAITLIGLFTLGVGLLIVLPAIPVLNSIFALICYYQQNKMRYYINENTIVNTL